jgi:hypothetical protein
MESRWLAFDRLVRDVGVLEELNRSPRPWHPASIAAARLAAREAAAAVERAAGFASADFDEHLLADAAVAVSRARQAAALAWGADGLRAGANGLRAGAGAPSGRRPPATQTSGA